MELIAIIISLLLLPAIIPAVFGVVCLIGLAADFLCFTFTGKAFLNGEKSTDCMPDVSDYF